MLSGKKSRLNSSDKGCGDSAITAHQRRFAGAVAPQYLNITTGGQHNAIPEYVLLHIYPYIAGAVFLISWLRYDYGQYTWRVQPDMAWIAKG